MTRQCETGGHCDRGCGPRKCMRTKALPSRVDVAAALAEALREDPGRFDVKTSDAVTADPTRVDVVMWDGTRVTLRVESVW